MSPSVVALISVSVLIFLACLSSGFILIHSRRLRHRTQCAAQVEAAQVQVAQAAGPEEKLEDVSSSSSSSSESRAAVTLLPSTAIPRFGSTAMTEKPVEKLIPKTSAALSTGDKYTTLPLRRSRQARQAKLELKYVTFDSSTSLATLDGEIVNSETGCSSMRSAPFATSGIDASSSTNTTSRSGLPAYSMSISRGNSCQSAVRPSPTIVSMEGRTYEADTAALPDAETASLLGSLPSLSNTPSAVSSRTARQPLADAQTQIEAGEYSSYGGLDCDTPRKRGYPTHAETRPPGTPCSTSTSVSTMVTTRDSSFVSDADTVCELDLGKATTSRKAFKFGDALSLTSDLSFDLSSGKRDDAIGLHLNSSSDDLGSFTKHPGDTKFEGGDLTPAALPDSSF
ncbi:hypothetical protein LXA43DRAFT_476810 [Ganoderma leucocontextum]|nr:hypothetical protein LXA43DRAFT_476810 [Ganoderma leucocontextum]